MTKETAKDYLPLVQALAEGKTIQVRYHGKAESWQDKTDPNWMHSPECYRIKPDPRRWWLVAFGVTQPLQVWTTRPVDLPCIEVVEVIK